MTGAALTADRLGEAWPEVSARLRRMLASRGVDPVLNDDIVQEVAVRALDKRVPFTDPNDLYRWAATTARNLHVDHLRCDGRTTYDDVLLAVPDGTDVAHTAERRVALGHVLRAMAGLRPGERAAILDSLDDREARSSQALVRRHRARATLRKAVGSAIGATVLGRLRLRALAPAMRPAAAALMVTPALLVGGGTLLDRPAAPAPAAPVVVAPAAPDDPDARRAAQVTPKRAGAGRVASRVTRQARPVAVRAPRAAGPKPVPRREYGPVVWENPERKDDRAEVCLETMQQPFWCASYVRRVVDDPPGGPL